VSSLVTICGEKRGGEEEEEELEEEEKATAFSFVTWRVGQ